MKYIKTILNRPLSMFLIIASVVLFGIMSVSSMQLEYFPDLEMPMEVIVATYPGADAKSVEEDVVKKIEDIGKNMSGIDNIESYSYENYGTITFTYEYDTDMDDAYMELKAATDNVQNDLPSSCSLKIMEISLDSDATISLSATSKTGSDITDYIDNSVIPELEALSGTAQVKSSSDSDKYGKIVLNKEKLDMYGISLSTVASEIANADSNMPAGSFLQGSQKISVTTGTSMDWQNDLMSLPIPISSGGVIELRNVTDQVNLFQEEITEFGRINGHDSILIDINKKSSVETIPYCNAVVKLVNQLSNEDVQIEVVSSLADDIMDSLKEVATTLIEGIIITMLVLFLFLGDVRASLIVGSSMPLSILMALIALKLVGVPFDLMTGTGMIIAIGMLVDNSIVILESCYRAKENQESFREAAITGATGMMMSVVASTITTVVVYAPISIARGMSGQMNKPLCYTVIFTMIASLINAVTVVPLLYSLVKPKNHEKLPINKVLSIFERGYQKIMPFILNHALIALSLTILLFVGACGLAGQLPFDIFPLSYDGSIEMDITFRSGTDIAVVDESIKEIEETLLADSNFNHVEVNITSGKATMKAEGAEKCTRTSEKAVEYYTDKFSQYTNMDISISPKGVTAGLASLIGSGNNKVITIEGEDEETLQQASELVVQRLQDVPGIMKISNPITKTKNGMKFEIDKLKARFYGLQVSSISNYIYTLLNGIKATSVTMDENTYDIKVQYPDDMITDPATLLNQTITTSKNKKITLGDVCDIHYVQIQEDYHRLEGKFIAEITATTTSEERYQTAAIIDKALSDVVFPEGVSITQNSTDKSVAKEMSTLGSALVIAVFLVFLVMALQFNSIRYSLMVMMCIPFSLIGSFTLMFLMNQPLSMMAMMGILMLIGMVVNNGILLVDGANELKKDMTLKEALIQAGLTRLRPILMTTLTTVLSMLPPLLSGNGGMNMMKGMGIVIIGGLVASTLLAMFLMPCCYILFSGKNKN